MKKLITTAVITLCIAGIVPAQDITISGEIKTGLFWYDNDIDTLRHETGTFIHNNEDTTPANLLSRGGYGAYIDSPARFRLNFQVENQNVGVKFRFETTKWPHPSTTRDTIFWGYAFAYGYFWDNQIKISGGKMGDSPWGSGGPEMWRELDTAIGMRFEFIPSFIPFIKPGQLNLGFVLNDMNASIDGALQTGLLYSSFGDILQESVLGLAYTHDYFLLRLAYRLDSKIDDDKGGKFIYRVEERTIQKFLPGFQIWANGAFENIGTEELVATNWLYIQYAPEWFTAQIRVGYDLFGESNIFYVRAGFYYNLFNNLLIPGIAFEYAQDSGIGRRGSDDYLRWYIEPQLKLNLGNGTYVAFVYRYQDDYERWNISQTTTVNSKTSWINIRVVFTF